MIDGIYAKSEIVAGIWPAVEIIEAAKPDTPRHMSCISMPYLHLQNEFTVI
ncbi:hypothetical protein [Kineothrix sedimenti]|uniref:Uncharacterized protein n=1 Tax=Kineothrix sedimenti TaxID=3123317 RepID=A0ABZ3F258_9FIRM